MLRISLSQVGVDHRFGNDRRNEKGSWDGPVGGGEVVLDRWEQGVSDCCRFHWCVTLQPLLGFIVTARHPSDICH
jgi:hypothetical protein